MARRASPVSTHTTLEARLHKGSGGRTETHTGSSVRTASIPEDVQSPNVSVVAGAEERLHSIDDRDVLAARTHARVLTKFLRHHKEEVVGVLAKMALPEVKEVHVVDGGFASFHLHQTEIRR